MDCTANALGSHNCAHSDDAGVICTTSKLFNYEQYHNHYGGVLHVYSTEFSDLYNIVGNSSLHYIVQNPLIGASALSSITCSILELSRTSTMVVTF